MIDARNVVVLTGGIVTEPEKPTEKIVKFRMVVDGAGREANETTGKKETSGGFFDVVYYINDDPNGRFVSGQLAAGNMKKGSSIAIAGRLEHDRFKTKEGQKASRVQIVAESISYAGRKPVEADGNGHAAAPPATKAAEPAGQETAEVPVEF
jgi:single-strand DNA-binding protein